MRDMANLYRVKTTEELKKLRSIKANKLNLLEAAYQSFFVKREVEALKHQIHQIDVELAARLYQMRFPNENSC